FQERFEPLQAGTEVHIGLGSKGQVTVAVGIPGATANGAVIGGSMLGALIEPVDKKTVGESGLSVIDDMKLENIVLKKQLKFVVDANFHLSREVNEANVS